MCHRIMAIRMSELVDAMERRGQTGRAPVALDARQQKDAMPRHLEAVLLQAGLARRGIHAAVAAA